MEAKRLPTFEEIMNLGLIVYGPEAMEWFLKQPMPLFDGCTALQLIERGEADRVFGALAADYEGQGF